MLTTLAMRVVGRVPVLVPVIKRAFPPRPDGRRLNLGGGRWCHPRWENVDLYVDPRFVDRQLDLRTLSPIDYPDGCAELVFSSHVLEHVSDEQAEFVLAEAHRLLGPGGTLRLAVPDAEKAFAAYRKGDEEFFRSGGVTCHGDSLEQLLVNFFASYRMDGYSGGPPLDPEAVRLRLQALEPSVFMAWCASCIPADAPYRGHVNGYDFAKLSGMLRAAGFGEIERSSFRKSRVAELRGSHFDNRPVASLYVEARL